jgi:hypothetical protein
MLSSSVSCCMSAVSGSEITSSVLRALMAEGVRAVGIDAPE